VLVTVPQLVEPEIGTQATTLACALEQAAANAGELDRSPRFPTDTFRALSAAGVPQLAADRNSAGLNREIGIVRALAAVDASAARILDGHFNGVERLALCAAPAVREPELEGVAAGELLLGVWGADPAPGEGPAAKLEQRPDGALLLRGVKTFCSGAGGVQRALVTARDAHGVRRLAYVDVTDGIDIDRGWYRASGLRSSESHRVEFRETPVLALLGGEDELMSEPWLSRDAVRTAATWAGLADAIVTGVVLAMAQVEPDQMRMHSLGRMRVAQATIDRWLEHAASVLGNAVAAARDFDAGKPAVEASPCALSGECRVAIADAARTIAAAAASACGSRALIDGGALDRARRDLDLFLLQHRLDPKLVQIGAGMLAAGA
jgi:hypothetical protein